MAMGLLQQILRLDLPHRVLAVARTCIGGITVSASPGFDHEYKKEHFEISSFAVKADWYVRENPGFP